MFTHKCNGEKPNTESWQGKAKEEGDHEDVVKDEDKNAIDHHHNHI